MRYAATIVGLRPKGGLRKGIGGGCYRTDSCLTVDKNTMALLELGFKERNSRDKVVQDVFTFVIVDFDLFVDEGLSGK